MFPWVYTLDKTHQPHTEKTEAFMICKFYVSNVDFKRKQKARKESTRMAIPNIRGLWWDMGLGVF